MYQDAIRGKEKKSSTYDTSWIIYGSTDYALVIATKKHYRFSSAPLYC